jgi:hypothetical protein
MGEEEAEEKLELTNNFCRKVWPRLICGAAVGPSEFFKFPRQRCRLIPRRIPRQQNKKKHAARPYIDTISAIIAVQHLHSQKSFPSVRKYYFFFFFRERIGNWMGHLRRNIRRRPADG